MPSGAARPRVLVSVRVNAEQLACLQAAAPDVELLAAPGGIAFHPPGPLDLMEPTCPAWHPELDLAPLLATADAIIAYDLPADLRQRAPHLRWVQVFHAGVDGIWQPYLADADLAVTTVSGTHPIPMTEFVLSLLLYFSKQLDRFRQQQARREWRKAVLAELHGATLAIVGFGTIGRAVAVAAAQLGLRVLAVQRTPDRQAPLPAGVTALYGPDELATALAEAQYVVSILPRTPETENLWNEATFELLPRGAIFINVGRGRTVDEAALVRALASGRLGGAGLDVFASEPLAPESPLWETPNLLIIPHTGSETINYTDRALAIVAENLQRFATGQPLHNLIDTYLRY